MTDYAENKEATGLTANAAALSASHLTLLHRGGSNVLETETLGNIRTAMEATGTIPLATYLPLAGGTLTGAIRQTASRVVKTADESVTNSTTLQDDDELLRSVTSGYTYSVRALLYVDDAGGNCIKMALGGSATASYVQGSIRYNNNDGSVGSAGSWGNEFTALGTAINSTAIAHNGLLAEVIATVAVSGTGTLVVRWAQNTSNATPVTVKKGSWLLVEPF